MNRTKSFEFYTIFVLIVLIAIDYVFIRFELNQYVRIFGIALIAGLIFLFMPYKVKSIHFSRIPKTKNADFILNTYFTIIIFLILLSIVVEFFTIIYEPILLPMMAYSFWLILFSMIWRSKH